MELRRRALEVLCTAEPAEKAAQARPLADAAASLSIADADPPVTAPLPGRPERPELIHPAKVPRRSPSKPEGLAALLHAIAHIEFNAIKKAAYATSFCIAKWDRSREASDLPCEQLSSSPLT